MAAYPSIPITLPLGEEGPDYGVVETGMELGYVQTRARTTVAPREWSFSHNRCTAAERVTWIAFWNTHKGRATVFTFVDPHTGATVNARFNMKKPEIMRDVTFQRYNINVRLEEAL